MMTVLVIVLIVIVANILILMLFHGGDARAVNDRVRFLEDDDQMKALSGRRNG